MTSRKKNLILIQVTIFLVAVALLYNTYRNKNKETENIVKIEVNSEPNTNSFSDIEYSGFDLSGNRYVLKAKLADFKTETPELISMEGVVAKFYLKNNKILTVISEEGLYNNITHDIDFKKNVEANYLTNNLLSDSLSYSNSNAKLIATGNVRGESIEKGQFKSDNVEYDLKDSILNFSMFNNKQVNVKIKNK